MPTEYYLWSILAKNNLKDKPKFRQESRPTSLQKIKEDREIYLRHKGTKSDKSKMQDLEKKWLFFPTYKCQKKKKERESENCYKITSNAISEPYLVAGSNKTVKNI